MTQKKIQLFVPTYHVEECLQGIRECLEIGWTGMGFKTTQFEDEWKKYTGMPHAHFVNSSTAGLHLAVKVYKEQLEWSNGDEIISTPLTFVSSNHAISYEGLVPVFADVDDTLCLDPIDVEKKISPRTRAVMYVGMGGNAGRLEEIIALCKKHNLILILDAAHMSGTWFNGTHAGVGIDCTVFSFHSVKNLPSADSGMVCFHEEKFDTLVRMYSWLGINKDTYLRSKEGGEGTYKWMYNVDYLGLKAHGNSIMAAICLAQLKTLESDNERRRELSSIYEQLLAGCEHVKFARFFDNCKPSRHLFQIMVAPEHRNKLIAWLNKSEIYPGVHYQVNTDYKMYLYAKGTCPNADNASDELISLPLHLRLTNDDVVFVCETILNYFKAL